MTNPMSDQRTQYGFESWWRTLPLAYDSDIKDLYRNAYDAGWLDKGVAQDGQAVSQDERETFAAEVRRDPHWKNAAEWLMRQDEKGDYIDVGVAIAWRYWQARGHAPQEGKEAPTQSLKDAAHIIRAACTFASPLWRKNAMQFVRKIEEQARELAAPAGKDKP